ncbi:hypothetical protein [Embleya sp. NPDC059237]|uniref:hypothetical protein n=1 Tax=Embleya sp. NPDC059237 TaxID=3346784 RepID=UPI00367F6FBB
MGAQDFYEVAAGTDLDTAFDDAVEQARHAYGHGGYTGTLAEKREYVPIDEEPRTEGQALRRAKELIDTNDRRISDKWGPAGALPMTRTPSGAARWLLFGWAPD